MDQFPSHGVTAGQAEVFQEWIVAQAAAATASAETLPEGSTWRSFYRGQAAAYSAALQALHVAALGALSRVEPTR